MSENMSFFRENGLGILFLTALFGGCGACIDCNCAKTTKIDEVYEEKHISIDQVIRDYNGYRVYLTEGNGHVREINIGESTNTSICPGKVDIFKDLPNEEKGYITCIETHEKARYEPKLLPNYNLYGSCRKKCEIHLPLDQILGAGIGTTGGKNPEHPHMNEIK